jgi:NAD(P)-dependent dehydrogenase (short-subunit alcohol dehydrogenase family)
MGRLDGRVAVVTGAAQGIGRAIAVRLAEDGADVVVGDIDKAALEQTVRAVEALGRRSCSVVGDSTVADVADDLVTEAVSRLGRIDVLVNNVGGSLPGKIWELTDDQWDTVIRLNLRSMFCCTRAAVRHMIRQQYGRIVSISSGAREGSPWQAYYFGASAYSTAKAGVHGFTRDVSLELAQYGINVNAVAPGPILTDRGREFFTAHEQDEYSAKKMTPLRRYGEVREVADAVAFLASDDASYITGQTINVTGGR